MASAKELLAAKLQQNNQQHSNAQKEQFSNSKEFRRNINLSEIVASPNQPRRLFDEAELKELADSISEIGLLQPIAVRRVQNGYELIAGERRLKAHQLLSKSTIEAIIIDASDEDVALLTLAENLKREDLTDYEIYIGLNALNEAIKKNKTKLAKSLGMNREDMYKYLSFEGLPDYIHNDLATQPKLIGRTVATAIKKYLADHSSVVASNTLQKVWDNFLLGKLEQTKIVNSAEALLSDKKKKTADTVTTHIKIDDQNLGKISFKNKKLKIDLSIDELNNDDLIKVESFLRELVLAKKEKV